ncbi:MAG: protein translocase subunit SecD [bacterium]|nr:protein translocase subunit SecD [bacterium]MDZ4231456.1 protein translocase subunit SecD [Patescibacteria group bacterium]
MQKRGKSTAVLVTIMALAILAGFFVYPGNIISEKLPWKLGLDLVGGSALVYEVDLSNIESGEYEAAVAGLREVIERRVNIFGVAEPRVTIAKKGDSYQLLIELAGVEAEDAAHQIGLTPVLEFKEVALSDQGEAEYIPTQLSGRFLEKATIGFDNLTNSALVALQFNDEGARIFAELTARNIGLPIAVFLDGELMTAPIVQQEITGGTAQITGAGAGFSPEEARTLVESFNAGALSAPIELINQRKVSASAAADSLNRIIFAGLIGTAVVLLFMALYYRSFGLVAGLALIIYTALSLGLFKVIPNFTMTLAGIAGFILSIGMAVDANILIFERTKEELKAGHSKEQSIEEGFKRAWTSIRDSNTTTIITAVILYLFTSSFVKGFALTLGLGVLVSMFSAIYVTRTILRVFMEK